MNMIALSHGAAVPVVTPDPIFAAIDKHKAACAWLNEAARAAGDDDAALEAAIDTAGDDDAAWELADTRPTTAAGCAAALAYAAEFATRHTWPDMEDDDGREWHVTLHETIAEALAAITDPFRQGRLAIAFEDLTRPQPGGHGIWTGYATCREHRYHFGMYADGRLVFMHLVAGTVDGMTYSLVNDFMIPVHFAAKAHNAILDAADGQAQAV